MEEVKNNELNNENTLGVDTNQELLDTIKDLKKNSVARSDYDKLRAEYSNLSKTVLDCQQPVEVDTSKEETAAEIRKRLFVDQSAQNDLEYITDILALREKVMKEGFADPFEVGNQGASAPRDCVDGEKVATELQEMVDEADGNPQVFRQIYTRSVEPIKRNPKNVID